MASQVAVVTGANKGIGLAIVRALCRHFGKDGVVYQTARHEGRGRAAVELLQKEGLNPKFQPLDVTDQSSIDKLRNHLENEHGGIDVLINNAGIFSLEKKNLYENGVRVMDTNFFGLLAVCRSLFPLVRPGGRIVNLSSWGGYKGFRKSNDDVKEKCRQAKSEQDVVDLMNELLQEFQSRIANGSGWSENKTGMYPASKIGVVLLSKIQAEMFTRDTSRKDILVNSCCPGFVLTDINSNVPDDHYGGTRLTTAEGADTPVFLALLPPGTKEPNGQFVMRRKAYDYINTDVDIALSEPAQ